MNEETKNRITDINNGIIPEGYKKTKVGIVPVEWDIVKMKDICEFIRNGYTYTPYNGENAVKVTRIETISDRTINLNNVGYSKNIIDEKYKLKIGDILFSHINSLTHIGKTAYFELDTELYHGMNLLCIRSNSKILSKYLFFWLNSDRANSVFKSYAKKAINQCSISTSEIEKIHFPLPPLPEQQKIAEILGAQDKLIELQERKINQLKTLKKGYLQKMFPKKGCKYPELRFKGFTDPWEQREFGELAENTYGGGTPNTSTAEYWNGNIPWIQSSDITEHQLFDVVPKKYISSTGLSKSATKLVPENSIAIVTRVGVGKLAILPFSYTTSQDFLSLSNLNVDIDFCGYLLYKKLQSELNAVQGTSIKGITKEELLKKKVLVPSWAEQQQIGTYFRNLDNLIALHQRKLDEEKQKKKALMQLLLTGKVRVIL